MKIVKLIVLFLWVVGVNAQTKSDVIPSEYIPAENYGGKVELKRFLQQELFYPEKALANKTQGTVELAFVVDVNTGKTSKLHVKSSVSPEIDAEAIRLYKMLQFEKPIYRAGKATVYSVLKIKFSVGAYKRYVKARGYENPKLNLMQHDTSMVIYNDDKLINRPKVIFDEGINNISHFLQRNLKYPENTLKLNLKGTVKLQFIVEPTGRITNIKLLKGLGGGATVETERLLKLLTWEAGEKDGKKVRTLKEFEVNYHLSNNDGREYVPNTNF